MTVTFGSLFAGIGGFDLGLERSGMACQWQVEIDDVCRSVLRRHFEVATHGSDVRDVLPDEFVRPDVICGGFPCQDLSLAGRRAGLAGKRSGLFHEFMRIVSDFSPSVVLIENVTGLLSSNGGRDMSTVVYSLAQRGYGWSYRVLDAQYFGLAQRRKRVFIVGCIGGDYRRSAKILFESEGMPWDSPPSRKVGQEIAASLTRVTGVGGSDPGRRREDDINIVHIPDITGTIQANCGTKHFLGNQEAFSGRYHIAYQAKDVPHVVNMQGGKGRCGYDSGIVPTLGSDNQIHGILPSNHIGMVRRLMPIEVERLQGFPDDWTRYRDDGAEIKDSRRYQMCGNAVAVPVAEWIGRRIVGSFAESK